MQFWPCVGSTACPAPRRIAVPARSHRLRSVRNDALAGRGGAVRGYPGAHPGALGVPNARDTLCPKPAFCPAPRRRAVPARPHRLRSAVTASRRPGGAGRYGPMVLGHRVWWRPSAKGAHELPRLHMCLGLRRHPRHSGTSLLGPTSDRRDAQRPWSAFLIATGPLSHPLALGRHDAARRRSARARRRAVGIFARGNKTRMKKLSAARGRKRSLGSLLAS